MITEATLAESAFAPPIKTRNRYRPETSAAVPVIRSTPFLHGTEPRLGVSVMFGGKAYLGSVLIENEDAPTLSGNAVADLLEALAGQIRSVA